MTLHIPQVCFEDTHDHMPWYRVTSFYGIIMDNRKLDAKAMRKVSIAVVSSLKHIYK